MASWQKAKIIKVFQSASDILSVIVEPEVFYPYRAGQHYELRIPEGDVSRKYSVVSAPYESNKYLEFGVQFIPTGVLSPKLWELKEGDEIEIRGPLGESFVWTSDFSGPLVLIGAGSGMTPLLSIYSEYRNNYPEGKFVFIISAKDSSRIMKYDLLKSFLTIRFTSTEGRINNEFLEKNIRELLQNKNTMCYICGPENFIDDMVDSVLELGIDEDNVKSERFI